VSKILLPSGDQALKMWVYGIYFRIEP
jgi:hypothetical protein